MFEKLKLVSRRKQLADIICFFISWIVLMIGVIYHKQPVAPAALLLLIMCVYIGKIGFRVYQLIKIIQYTSRSKNAIKTSGVIVDYEEVVITGRYRVHTYYYYPVIKYQSGELDMYFTGIAPESPDCTNTPTTVLLPQEGEPFTENELYALKEDFFLFGIASSFIALFMLNFSLLLL